MIAKIAPLAVLAAIAPATMTPVLVILRGPRPIRMLVTLYTGGLVASVAIGYAIVAALEGSGAFAGPNARDVSPSIDLVAGVLALLVAWWLGSGRAARRKQRREERNAGRPHRNPWSQRMLDRGSTPLIFAIGVLLNLPSGMYLVALKDVAASHPTDAAALAALIAFNLVMLASIEVLSSPRWRIRRRRSCACKASAAGSAIMAADSSPAWP